MAKHSVIFNFRMDAATRAKLQALSRKSGQPMSAVLRMLIHGTTVKEMPPMDYHKMNAMTYRARTRAKKEGRKPILFPPVVLDEFFRVALRENFYKSAQALQAPLTNGSFIQH